VFRSWTWLSTWWRHYGPTDSQPMSASNQLFVLAVYEGDDSPNCQTPAQSSSCTSTTDRLIAILPCYLQRSLTRGRVLRLLGDGEVCSDHLDLLATATNAPRAADALASYLCDHSDRWDLIDFPSLDINQEHVKIGKLIAALAECECHVSETPDQNCWTVNLPETWEDFLSLQSKSHRKQLRRLEKRVLESPSATWHQVKLMEDFQLAWPLFVDLHQRRRQSLGEEGCFASPRWASFHEEVARQLLTEGRLRMSWLELEGEPVAVDYHFASGRTTYAYQGGLDPIRLGDEPGRLSMIRTVQHAIAEGHRKLDLLRGDEPYKAHWRATPKETCHVQVVPGRTSAKWRYQAWNSAHGAARWVNQVRHFFS
jgi:CelD/BcsL family acetyltransferase involved in cellulose biosynthesis